MPRDIESFLNETGLLLSLAALREVTARLRAAMREGLQAHDQALRMIPAYVPPCGDTGAGEAIALDAGGTNVRAAVVRFPGGGRPAEVGEVRRMPLPGGDGTPVDGATFFGRLAELVAGLGRRNLPIGFVFSYPTRILPNRDGVLLHWTKEVRADDVVGTRVGAGLAEALATGHGLRPASVTVLNDTVAALAAASMSAGGRGTIGLIVGTGTNMAYFEHRAALTKLVAGEGGPEVQAVNMESGNFEGAPPTALDGALDASTGDPGRQRMEKQVSGRYLGELGRRAFLAAADAGLLTPPLAATLALAWSLPTSALSDVLARPSVLPPPLALATSEERVVLERVAEAVVGRSAALVAAGLAGVIEHLGPAAEPVSIMAEGTLFWMTPGYRERVEAGLRALLPSTGADRFAIRHVEDANLHGAAAAALS